MKIVVIGGSGLIGSKVVKKLREHGHAALAASPNSGVNTLRSRSRGRRPDTRQRRAAGRDAFRHLALPVHGGCLPLKSETEFC
jgi:uncharacterized protein YbjT (DUF2867 family)